MFPGYENPTPQQPVPCGRYQLIERIGYGGMAEVFRARLPGPNSFSKTVVVKRILPRLLDDPMVLQMFIEEARIAAAADHDNIAKVFELGRAEDGRYFIVMEFLAGIDLEMLLRASAQRSLRVPIWFSVKVVSEVLEALSYVHSLVDDDGQPRNVIHRDVTPSNIFLTFLGRVKLSDFGIADFAGKAPTTIAGQLKGKLAYMSPEQLNARTLDLRSDLFTAGVVLWEALTQQRLFGQLNEMQAMLAICDDTRKPPSALEPEVPPELDMVALKALAADRDQRYHNATEFQSDLLDCLHKIRGPVRTSDMRRVVQVLLGREEPDHETMAKPMTPARAREANASFLLKLDQSERKKLKAEHSAALLAEQGDVPDDLAETNQRGFPAVEVEDATLPMHAIDLSREYWVRSPGCAALGPMPYQAARVRLAEAGMEGAPISISADRRHWLSLEQFSRFSGQDLVMDLAAPGNNLTLIGTLEQRSMAAVFGLIARDSASGTLSIANTDVEEWYEIRIANGQPLLVITNVPSMQLPALLVSKKLMGAGEVDRWLHELVRSGQPEPVPLDRDAFMRERMRELFRWSKAEYSFNIDPLGAAEPPFAPSLLALLPPLIEAACSTDELKKRLGGLLEKGLEPSWRFADALDEMALPLGDRGLVERLKSRRPLATLVGEQPALAKRILTFAYLMTEADLLLEALED